MERPKRFVWDAVKAESNFKRHGVAFADVEGFDFDDAMVELDERHDYGETREVASGTLGSRVHVLVFTHRDDVCRVISLRKANKRELRAYGEHLRQQRRTRPH